MDSIKYKLSLLNKINHYQLALIHNIKSIYDFNNIKSINNILLYIIKIYNIDNIINIYDLIDIGHNNILNNEMLLKNKNICILYNSYEYDKNKLYYIISKYDKILFIIDEINSNNYNTFSNNINLYHNIIIIKYDYNTKYLISNVKNIDIILDKKY